MCDHQIGAVQSEVQIQRCRVWPEIDAGQLRSCFLQRLDAAVADGIQAAPPIGRLKNDDLMPELPQLARNAAEEMRVAIVPARGECVIEEDAFHACTSIA